MTVPAELLEHVRHHSPGLNLSALVAAALKAKAECVHLGVAECRDCGAAIDVWTAGGDRLAKFWADLWWDVIAQAVDDDVTPEGIARAARTVAERHQVPGAHLALPRPSRARRAANRRARTPMPTSPGHHKEPAA